MKKPDADYAAVRRQLQPHQLQTLNEVASARACDDWTGLAICAGIGVTLAVENMLNELRLGGVTERKALARIASSLDIDFETLLRQRRRNSQTLRSDSPDD